MQSTIDRFRSSYFSQNRILFICAFLFVLMCIGFGPWEWPRESIKFLYTSVATEEARKNVEYRDKPMLNPFAGTDRAEPWTQAEKNLSNATRQIKLYLRENNPGGVKLKDLQSVVESAMTRYDANCKQYGFTAADFGKTEAEVQETRECTLLTKLRPRWW